MHCNTVTTFKVGKLSQNSMPNLFLTFHSCMYVHLFNVHPTRRMLCPWPKIWIQLLLLLSKIFNFHIWDQSDSESLTFGKAWTQRASGLLVSLYFELSVPNSWVAEDEDRGVAPSAGFTSLFYVQRLLYERGRGWCPCTQLTTQTFYVERLLSFYKTHFTHFSRSIWPIPSFTAYRFADWKARKVNMTKIGFDFVPLLLHFSALQFQNASALHCLINFLLESCKRFCG